MDIHISHIKGIVSERAPNMLNFDIALLDIVLLQESHLFVWDFMI